MKNHLRPKKNLSPRHQSDNFQDKLSFKCGSAPESSLPLLLVQSNLLGVFLAENARQAWIGAGVGWERTGTSDCLGFCLPLQSTPGLSETFINLSHPFSEESFWQWCGSSFQSSPQGFSILP